MGDDRDMCMGMVIFVEDGGCTHCCFDPGRCPYRMRCGDGHFEVRLNNDE